MVFGQLQWGILSVVWWPSALHMLQVLHTLGADLSPQQLGCGVPLGCEAATHAARRYLHDMPPGHQLLKLDFMNAFNCLCRDNILSAVKDSAPELFKFVFSAYSSPVIQSAEGVQQGDPLGPLFFCLTIHPLVLKLTSDFKVF